MSGNNHYVDYQIQPFLAVEEGSSVKLQETKFGCSLHVTIASATKNRMCSTILNFYMCFYFKIPDCVHV